MRPWKLVGILYVCVSTFRLDISSKLKNTTPSECRRHYEFMYITGIMSSARESLRPATDANFNDSLDSDSVVYTNLIRLSNEHCKLLGLMPKTGDYEYVSSNFCRIIKF